MVLSKRLSKRTRLDKRGPRRRFFPHAHRRRGVSTLNQTIKGQYQVLFPSSVAGPNIPLGTYTVSGTGGKDIGAFSTSVTVASHLAISNKASLATFDPTQPLAYCYMDRWHRWQLPSDRRRLHHASPFLLRLRPGCRQRIFHDSELHPLSRQRPDRGHRTDLDLAPSALESDRHPRRRRRLVRRRQQRLCQRRLRQKHYYRPARS